MLNSATQGETPLLFSDLDGAARCVFCGKPRPLELLSSWMCHLCKRKSLWELFWKIEEAS